MNGWLVRCTNRLLLLAVLLLFCGCVKRAVPAPFQDRSFYSPALGRKVTYRILRTNSGPEPMRVAYLLHGHGGSYREWSEHAAWQRLAAAGFTLVMPEGQDSYFLNAAERPRDRYEDFVTTDLRQEVEGAAPVQQRILVGVSMGGYAALVLALRHPDLYSFAGALSPPVDIASVPFTWKHLSRSLMLRRIFGPSVKDSSNERPVPLVRRLPCGHAPFLFISAGAQEPLLRDIRPFTETLHVEHYRNTFQVLPGGHDWTQWNMQLPGMVQSLRQAPEAKCSTA